MSSPYGERFVKSLVLDEEPRKSMASPLSPSIVIMPVYPLTLTISTRFISPPAQLKSNILFRIGPSSECLINSIPPQPALTFFLRGLSNLLLPSSVSLLLTSSTCLFLYLCPTAVEVSLDISNSQISHT